MNRCNQISNRLATMAYVEMFCGHKVFIKERYMNVFDTYSVDRFKKIGVVATKIYVKYEYIWKLTILNEITY